MEKQSWGQKLWHRFESAHTAYWLTELFFAALAAWKSRHLMPSAINPADYWLPIAVFFGVLLIFSAGVQIVKWVIRWGHPPSLRITAHSGKDATIEIQHSGAPIVWEARMRIIRTPKDEPNPDSVLRQCNLRKDGNAARSLLLKDQESANIVLAIIELGHPLSRSPQGWLAVIHADNEHQGTRVPPCLVVELILETKPRREKYSIRKCFLISREENLVECSEVACDSTP